MIGYVLESYPRFSETFVVSEILAREAQGERIVILSLRPTADARFHPELARVQAPVVHVPRPRDPAGLWATLGRAADDAALAPALARHLPELLGHAADDAAQAVEVALRARELGVGHLHAHFANLATTVARLAARLAGLPYSFTAHAMDIFRQDVDAADLERKLADAHHAVTISEYNLRHLRSRFPAATGRLHLVRNGLDLDRFPFVPRPPAAVGGSSGTGAQPAVRGSAGAAAQPAAVGPRLDPPPHLRPVRLLGVGRLVEKKGFALLVDAVRRLRAQGMDVTAEIAGDGPLREALERQVGGLGLDDAVRLLGPVTQAEVASLLGSRDLFVAPFVVGADGNVDGLPTVLLEAMARGIPCVAADVTAVPEVITTGSTGWLVPTGDVDALAGAIAEAARPGADHRELVLRARERVEQLFDSGLQARRLRDLYFARE